MNSIRSLTHTIIFLQIHVLYHHSPEQLSNRPKTPVQYSLLEEPSLVGPSIDQHISLMWIYFAALKPCSALGPRGGSVTCACFVSCLVYASQIFKVTYISTHLDYLSSLDFNLVTTPLKQRHVLRKEQPSNADLPDSLVERILCVKWEADHPYKIISDRKCAVRSNVCVHVWQIGFCNVSIWRFKICSVFPPCMVLKTQEHLEGKDRHQRWLVWLRTEPFHAHFNPLSNRSR